MHFKLPYDNKAILSAKASASSIAWVVRIITLSSFILLIIFHTYLLETGSIPVVGSSIIIILGYPIVLMANESLLFIPPLNVYT